MNRIQNLKAAAQKIASQLKIPGEIVLGSRYQLSPFWIDDVLILIEAPDTLPEETAAIAKAKKINAHTLLVTLSEKRHVITAKNELDLDDFDDNGKYHIASVKIDAKAVATSLPKKRGSARTPARSSYCSGRYDYRCSGGGYPGGGRC